LSTLDATDWATGRLFSLVKCTAATTECVCVSYIIHIHIGSYTDYP